MKTCYLKTERKRYRYRLKTFVQNPGSKKQGYHWMKQPDGSLKIMKHTGPFKKHKGASLKVDFPVQKVHSNGKKKKRS